MVRRATRKKKKKRRGKQTKLLTRATPPPAITRTLIPFGYQYMWQQRIPKVRYTKAILRGRGKPDAVFTFLGCYYM